MAKIGKLGKLLKKMQSIGRNSTVAASNSKRLDDSLSYTPASKLFPVYVGKTRRCYMVNSDIVSHPLFRELVDRSPGNNGYCEEISVGCEVVLFEHLLWMLDNVDNQADHDHESLDELVDFYAC